MNKNTASLSLPAPANAGVANSIGEWLAAMPIVIFWTALFDKRHC